MPKFKDEESLAGSSSSRSPHSQISPPFRPSTTSPSSLDFERDHHHDDLDRSLDDHKELDRYREGEGSSSDSLHKMARGFYERDRRRSGGGYSLCQICLAVCTTLIVCIMVYLWLQRPQVVRAGSYQPPPVAQATAPSTASHVPGKRRAAVIMSSFLQQNISWTNNLSKDWELVPYIMDDPDAQYVVPRNQGREAMSYTTYIIDHYDDLPDYMVFVHGHEKSWHQLEPMDWKVNSLNFTALEEDGYISLRCSIQPGCLIKEVDLTIPPFQRTEPWDIYMPLFYRKTFERAVAPRHIAAPCCAQFAVSKGAVKLHSKDWWIKFRRPMLRDLEDFEWGYGMDNWHIGLLYEKIWHIAFGKPPVYCPNENYCRVIQWSNGVSCDVDRDPLFTESYGWEHIKCHKNYEMHPGVPVFGDEVV